MEFVTYRFADGSFLFDFHSIEMAASKEGADPAALEWVEFGKVDRFPVVVGSDFDLAGSREYLDMIPHDDMDSYNIYVTLMDVLMYERYCAIARHMDDQGVERAVEPPRNEKLPDWKPLITGIDFPDSRDTVIERAGRNSRGETVFVYKQDGTVVRQTIHLNGMNVGTDGTTRFMGMFALDSSGALVRGSMFEYFAMKVNVLLIININKLVKREQVIERIQA
jgi:hypothetical protein